MDKKRFSLSPAMINTLLESDKETFIANFAQEYYLDGAALGFILPLLPDDEARHKFILENDLLMNDCDRCYPEGVIEALSCYFSYDGANELLAQKGLFNVLDMARTIRPDGHAMSLLQVLISQGKYLDEIWTFFKESRGEYERAYFAKVGHHDVLEKHEDWSALGTRLYYGDDRSFGILFTHHQYDEIISRGEMKDLQFLYEQGLGHLIVEYCQRNDAKVRSTHIQVFLKSKEWRAFKDKKLFSKLDSCFGFAGLGVLARLEQEGEDIKDFMNFWYNEKIKFIGELNILDALHRTFEDREFEKDIFLSWLKVIPHEKSIVAWLYKNLKDERSQKAVFKYYPWYSKVRRKMKDPNFPTTLAEIEKALYS